MTTPPATVASGESTQLPTEIPVAEKRKRWFEVCLLILVAVGSNIVNAIYLLIAGPSGAFQILNSRYAAGIVHEAALLLLLSYILSRRGRKFADLGLRWSLGGVGMGLLLIVISQTAYSVGSGLTQGAHFLIYGSYGHSLGGKDFFAHPGLMAIPYAFLNPFFEELIVRAYLMTEVIQLTGSRALAVVLSLFVQFSYHLYYGWIGAISLSFIFLVLAVYYARSRRALPIILAHGYFDVYALMRLW